MKLEKKYIIAIGLGVVSLALAYAYLQYKRLMNYKIGFKGVKVKTMTPTKINIDLYLKFENKSTLAFDITSQDYEVYVNDTFVSKVVNYGTNKIAPLSTSTIGVNVVFNPQKVLAILKKNFASVLMDTSSLKIRTNIKLKVSLYGIKVSIPFVYESTLKEMMSAPPPTE